jgi:hypothetical protein
MRLAQRFNAGEPTRGDLSPEGAAERTDLALEFSRPFGTRRVFARFPALKRWASLVCPSGTTRHLIRQRHWGYGRVSLTLVLVFA